MKVFIFLCFKYSVKYQYIEMHLILLSLLRLVHQKCIKKGSIVLFLKCIINASVCKISIAPSFITSTYMMSRSFLNT